MAEYGIFKLDSEDTHRLLCRQRLGDISPYSFEGSFESLIEFFKKEKKYYKEYLKGCEVSDQYLESNNNRIKKFVKFSQIVINYNSFSEDEKYTVYGLRELDDVEKAFREAQSKKAEEEKQREKREQYEKLKKEFEKQ